MENLMTLESYLESLAAEGETVLYVRQKPLDPPQYHADGAIKATWPAFRPEDVKRRKPGQAWYVNTGSFILDRFENGRPAAKSENV